MPDIPESLLRRSAEAKAKALGVPVDQVLAEMKGEAPSSTPAAAADAPAAPKPQPGASAESAADPDVPEPDTEAATAEVDEPETLSAGTVATDSEPTPAAETESEPSEGAVAVATEAPEQDDIAQDDADGPEPAEIPAPDSNGSGNGSANGAKVAAMVTARPVTPPTDTPEGVRTQRLLTVVKAKAIQQVKTEPTDKVNTWPHLMVAEFGALLAMTALLVVLSVILQAPLLEPANFNATPNPSKAPWYFLGLQELLSYFDPQVAGVTVPTIIGLVGFMMIPYVDRNPSTKPSDRKFAIMLYTIFLTGSATLTILGVLFRAQGFNFAFPWEAGIFFDDLKDWVHFEGEH